MIIEFYSEFKDSKNEKQKIKFEAPLILSEENNFRILEFLEPSKKIKNRIEYNDEKILIFAGPTILELEKNKKVKNKFQTMNDSFILVSFLKDYKNHNNEKIELHYDLLTLSDEIINTFKIKIKIKKL
ncbi:MAG: hypothetical protein ACRCRZ_00450 [Metamycoplasmataceae bacterium]